MSKAMKFLRSLIAPILVATFSLSITVSLLGSVLIISMSQASTIDTIISETSIADQSIPHFTKTILSFLLKSEFEIAPDGITEQIWVGVGRHLLPNDWITDQLETILNSINMWVQEDVDSLPEFTLNLLPIIDNLEGPQGIQSVLPLIVGSPHCQYENEINYFEGKQLVSCLPKNEDITSIAQYLAHEFKATLPYLLPSESLYREDAVDHEILETFKQVRNLSNLLREATKLSLWLSLFFISFISLLFSLSEKQLIAQLPKLFYAGGSLSLLLVGVAYFYIQWGLDFPLFGYLFHKMDSNQFLAEEIFKVIIHSAIDPWLIASISLMGVPVIMQLFSIGYMRLIAKAVIKKDSTRGHTYRHKKPKPAFATNKAAVIAVFCILGMVVIGIVVWQSGLSTRLPFATGFINFTSNEGESTLIIQEATITKEVPTNTPTTTITESPTPTIVITLTPTIPKENFKTLEGHVLHVDSVAWSPNLKQLATGGGDNIVILWDTSSGEQILSLRGHEDEVNSIDWSPDGKRIATGSDDRTIRIWDFQSQQEVKQIALSSRVQSIDWSPDNKSLVSGSQDGYLRIWNSQTGREIRQLKMHDGAINSISWAFNNQYIASAGEDGVVLIIDPQTGRQIYTFIGHEGSVNAVASSPDSRLVASGGDDTLLKIWDVDSGMLVSTLDSNHTAIIDIAWASMSDFLASVHLDGEILVWDVRANRLIQTISGVPASDVCWSYDSHHLGIGASDSVVRVWDFQLAQTWDIRLSGCHLMVDNSGWMGGFIYINWGDVGDEEYKQLTLPSSHTYYRDNSYFVNIANSTTGDQQNLNYNTLSSFVINAYCDD